MQGVFLNGFDVGIVVFVPRGIQMILTEGIIVSASQRTLMDADSLEGEGQGPGFHRDIREIQEIGERQMPLVFHLVPPGSLIAFQEDHQHIRRFPEEGPLLRAHGRLTFIADPGILRIEVSATRVAQQAVPEILRRLREFQGDHLDRIVICGVVVAFGASGDQEELGGELANHIGVFFFIMLFPGGRRLIDDRISDGGVRGAMDLTAPLDVHGALDPLVEEIQEERQELIGIVLLEVLKVIVVLRTRLLEGDQEFVRIDHPPVVIRPHLSLEGKPLLHQTVFQVHALRLKGLMVRMETQEVTQALQSRIHVARVPQVREAFVPGIEDVTGSEGHRFRLDGCDG